PILEDLRHALERRRRVDAAACEPDRLTVEVRREDPDLELRLRRAEHFGNEDAERVGLLTGRAPGRPDPHLTACLPRLLGDLRQEVLPDVVEHLGVAEELRDLDEERADEPLPLVRMAAPEAG